MLAFLGGTGPEGRGLALRLALAGEDIIIGSRDAERAATAAAELTLLIVGIGGVAGAGTTRAGTNHIEGADNLAAAARADSAFITVPYEAQRPLLEPLVGSLSGKVVVNVIAPMRFERGRGAIAVPVEAGSAAEEAQLLLPDSPVVAAFQNVSAEELQEPERAMEGDVVVCADDRQAKTLVMSLAEKIQRLRPVDGGSLANAKYVEQITPLLVNINRIYKIHSGIRIVGV
jgi:NADPH-dependent F420 reductase